MIIYAEEIFYLTICDSRYEKIWKNYHYFQNINIVVFFFSKIPLNIYTTHCRIYVLMYPKSNFMHTDMRKLVCLNFKN